MIRRGGVKVADVPEPLVDRGRVLIRVAYSFVSSGTETLSVRNAESSALRQVLNRPDQVKQVLHEVSRRGVQATMTVVRSKLATELPLGYSAAGKVLAVGPGVAGFEVGQPVACAGSGWATHAEVVSVPANLVVAIPQECDMKSASSVSLGAIALQGVRRADVRVGDVVVVIGLGLVGQLTAQLLRTAGCQVIATDLDASRVELAERLSGCRGVRTSAESLGRVVDAATGAWGADSTIIAASTHSDDVVNSAARVTRRKGRVVVVGDVGLRLDRSEFYEKELDLLLSCSYGAGRYDRSYEEDGIDYPYPYVRWTENRNMAAFLHLVASGHLHIVPLVDREFSPEEASDAYEHLRTADPRPVSVVFRHRLDKAIVSGSTPRPTKGRGGRVRIAVVGAGAFASITHIPNLRALGDQFEVGAVVSATGRHAQAAVDRVGAGYATTSLEDVLNDPGIDAVLISTRHHLHVEQAALALTAGKHVYCEKPLALDEAGLTRVISAAEAPARERHRASAANPATPILMVGYNRRFAPAVVVARKAMSDLRSPSVILYRVNAGRLPPRHWINGEQGGGRVIGEACHMLDLLCHLVGAPLLDVGGVGTAAVGRPWLGFDNFEITVRFEDGSIGVLAYTTEGHGALGKERIEIAQGSCSLVIDDFRSLEVHGYPISSGKRRSEDKGHIQALAAFATAISSGSPPMSLREIEISARLAFTADRLVRGVQ